MINCLSEQLYFAGESYAGQHIPYIARAILSHNNANPARAWNLKGLLIGNGWISPVDQSFAILQYAYQSRLIHANTSPAAELEAQQAICAEKLAGGGAIHVETGQCEQILRDIFRLTQDPSLPPESQCINMYDTRRRDTYPACGGNWPPDLPFVEQYLRRPDVVASLHVDATATNASWTQCTKAVGSSFKARHSTPSITFLPALLTHLPIVLYSGDKDLICNHLGTEALIAHMAWNGG